MADSLGEANWKAFTKKQKLDLDDAALLKALAKFDKTDIAKPEPRVQALDEVVDQAKKQVVALAKKKKELGDTCCRPISSSPPAWTAPPWPGNSPRSCAS
jgi:hypothetical protein